MHRELLNLYIQVEDLPRAEGERAMLAYWDFEQGRMLDAEQGAQQALLVASQNRRAWSFDSSCALHFSHIVLGRIALQKGDSAAARQHLMESVQVPWSDPMKTYGPNTKLAEELFSKGESDIVLEYLDECDDWWIDRSTIQKMRKGVMRGSKMIHWPDEQDTLLYNM